MIVTLALKTTLEKVLNNNLAMTTNLLHFIGWHNDDYGHQGYRGIAQDKDMSSSKGSVDDGSIW